jgi:hypothetical protein
MTPREECCGWWIGRIWSSRYAADVHDNHMRQMRTANDVRDAQHQQQWTYCRDTRSARDGREERVDCTSRWIARRRYLRSVFKKAGVKLMVGGVIIGLTKGDRIHVHVADCPHYPPHARGKCPRPDTCCVYTDALLSDGSKADMRLGDSFWWQCGWCYWTPLANRQKKGAKCGIDYDIKMKKLGYSH